MHKTAVVILNWNGIAYLREFLGTVIRYSVEADAGIYIADNGSTDGSVEWIEENHRDVKIIRFDKNHGFAGGYNLALEQIDAQYYVLLNSDIEVTSGWLLPLINYMDENPGAASCQPKILSYNKKDYFEYAGAAGGFIDKYGYPYCRGRIFDVVEKDKGQYDKQCEIFWSSGACMIVRSSVWEKCGGFDSSFFAHMEEIDLCWRFSKAGYRVGYIPESVVYHIGGGALPYDSPFKTYLNFRNSLFMLYKNLPEEEFHTTLFKRKFLDGLAALTLLLKGRAGSFLSVWKAHLDYYKCIGELKEKRKAIKTLGNNPIYPPLLNKSIIFEFYIKGNKFYNSLVKEK